MRIADSDGHLILRLKGHTEIENGGFVLDILETPDPVELEDAYMKYANAKVCPPRPGEKAYRVRGTKEPFYTLNIIDGIMSVAEVMKVAKSYNATITEYFNAVLLYALMQKQESEWHLKLRPVKIAMPVNLRRFFPSKTLRNFITMIYPGIDPRLGEYTFEEIVTQVHNYMRYYLNEKLLRGDITTNAETQRNPFIRVVPLFIKDLVVRQFYTKIQDKNSSAGLTNMGALKVPETMKPYIERLISIWDNRSLREPTVPLPALKIFLPSILPAVLRKRMWNDCFSASWYRTVFM